MKRHWIALQLTLVAACIALPGAACAQAEQKFSFKPEPAAAKK